MNTTLRIVVLCAVVVAAAASLALAMGGKHPTGTINKQHGGWPDEILSLINGHGRVHGHWVNANDEFFYRGDAVALAEFLEEYSGLKGVGAKLVVHVGSKRRSALWGDQPDVPYDWKLLICRSGVPAEGNLPVPGESGYTTQVDVWLGPGIPLESLKIPKSIRVESSGDLERFIRNHNAAATADSAPTTRPAAN